MIGLTNKGVNMYEHRTLVSLVLEYEQPSNRLARETELLGNYSTEQLREMLEQIAGLAFTEGGE